MIFDPCKQVRLDAANLPDHLADLTSGLGGLGIVVRVGEVIAQITDLIEVRALLWWTTPSASA